jgi:hypothetical protein
VACTRSTMGPEKYSFSEELADKLIQFFDTIENQIYEILTLDVTGETVSHISFVIQIIFGKRKEKLYALLFFWSSR